jgi:flagellar hook assembly protein FlgD
VRSLLRGAQPAGLHNAVWRGRDDRGRVVASGVYFYRLETDEGSFTGKMVLTK